MKQPRICDACGVELPSRVPEGLCPVCLLRLGAAELGLDTPDPRAGGPSPTHGNAGLEAGSSEATVAGGAWRLTSQKRLGDYELLERIGQGGMGVVYKARQISLDRVVALKLLPFGQFSRADTVERFRAEASAAAGLQHPNIVAIHEVGEQDGHHYFSMDYVAGQTLAEVVREIPLPAKRAAAYLKTVAEAVHCAHQHGILHRDLKPSNILIDASDQPHVTDFGLAKRLAVQSDLTLTGQVLGSPNFMSPEQAEGRIKEVGPGSDVYSLGGLLYHLLTRQPPFQGATLTTLLKQVIEVEPVSPCRLNPGIPRDLETICLKCLEKDPRRRYLTALELARELGRFLGGEPILARPVGAVGLAWKWCQRRPAMAVALAALGLTFLLGTAGVLWQWQQTRLANVDAQRREYAATIGLVESLMGDKQFDRAQEALSQRAPERFRGWEWGWLQRQCNQDLVTLREQGGGVAGSMLAAFDPNSRILATDSGFSQSSVFLWNRETGEKLRTLVGHTGQVFHAAFSPDGRQLATSSLWDTKTIIWEVATGQQVRQLPHPQAGADVAYSRNGTRLATTCWDGKVRLWDTKRWIQIDESPPYGDHVYCAEFSPDGRQIAYGGGYYIWANSRNTTVCIWDLERREVQPLEGHTQCVVTVAWSPSSHLLASGAWDGEVLLWDTESGRRVNRLAPGAKRGAVCRVRFSPDGRSLAIVGNEVSSANAWAQVLEVPSLRVRYELSGHSKTVMGLDFSRDGQYLATAANDGVVKVWLADPLPPYLNLEGHDQTVWKVAFSPNGHFVATGSLDQTAKLWDATTGALRQTIPVNFPVVSLAFSPAGDRLVTVGPDNAACVWQIQVEPKAPDPPRGFGARQSPGALASGPTPVRNVAAKAPEDWRTPRRLRGHTGTVMAVGWDPNNRWIATGGKDNQVILWDVATGREYRRLSGHADWVLALAFSPRGKLLATGGADKTIRLWDMRSAQCLRTLTNQMGEVLSLAFSPDGRLLAAGGADTKARIWEVRSGRELHSVTVSISGVTSVAFSPDSTRLVTAASGFKLDANWQRDSRIRLWDVSLGQELLSFVAHTNAVYGAAFSPDGRRMVTGSRDNTARIWTVFPWKPTEYPGNSKLSLADRIENYKRQFWRANLVARHGANLVWKDPSQARRPGVHPFGDFNLPLAGAKTQPLREIPLRSPQAGADQLDLTPCYNVALNESWQPLEGLGQVDLSLAALPQGLQTFAQVQFDVRGLIQLRRGAVDCELFPERVAVPVTRTFTQLHALHGTRWPEEEGTNIAALVLQYTDGAEATLPIAFGQQLRHEKTKTMSTSECPDAALAWLGPAPTSPPDIQLRLYKTTFPNPRPAMAVRRIEYISKATRSAPFLVALTVQ